MFPRSAEFDDVIRGHRAQHKIATQCTILPSTGAQQNLITIDGSVTINGKSTTRRTAWFTSADPNLVPTDAGSLLTPFVNEFQLFRGVYIPSTGLPELIPLGIFGITDVQVYDSGTNFSIRVTGYDRSKLVSRHILTQDLDLAAGTVLTTAIQTMILTAVPGITFSIVPTTITIPELHFQVGDDMWAKADELASSIGYNLYFDVNGVCVLTPVPDPSTQSDSWTFQDNQDSIMIYTNKHQANSSTINHVIVIGENPDGPGSGPIRAEAMDTDPNSPTRISGPYGDVADTVRDRHITSQQQAQMMANGLLLQGLGISEEVELTNIVHPAFDVNDVINIVRARAKLNARYVIDGLSIPLTHNRAMTISTRKRTVAFA